MYVYACLLGCIYVCMHACMKKKIYIYGIFILKIISKYKPVYSYSTNPDRRFSSSTSQHFKMFPPFASSEGYSASGVRYQSDGVRHPPITS